MKLEKSQWVLLGLTTLFVTFTLAFFLGRNSIRAVITTQSVTNDPPAQIVTGVPDAPQAQEALPPTRVNLNTATASELEELPGIGPKLAERIVAWREENGGFVSVEQLMDVNGIAEGKFEELKELIYVEAAE